MPLTQIKDDVIQNLNANKVTGAFTTSADGSQLTGLSAVDWDLRYNLAINYFNDSVRENFDRSGLDQGWIDVFKDTDDVDGEGVSVPMTKFDGVNDYLSTSPSNLGISNGKKFTMSFWYEPSVDSVDELFFAQNNNTFFIGRTTSGQLRVRYKSNTTTVIGDVFSPANKITVAGGKTHILIVIDTTQTNATDRVKISFNGGAIETLTDSTSPVLDGVIDITTDPTILIGSKIAGNDKIRGNLGQFYLAEDAVDISVQANRELFYKDGNPVNFGSNGSKPTGSSPIIYLNNPYGSFQTNLGSGGPFSVTGELVDGGYITDKIYDSGADSFSNSYELIDSHGKEHYSSIVDLQSAFSSSNAQANIISLPDCVITGLSVYGKARTSADGNVFAFIRGIASGTIAGNDAVPDENIIATSTKTVSSLPTSLSVIHFDFPEPVVLTAGEYAIGTECTSTVGGFDRATTRSSNYSGGGGSDTIDADTFHAIRLNASGWINTSTTSPPFSDNAHQNQPFYLYGQKNLDLITKGSDDIGNSPSTAPTKGHMEVLMTGHNTITAKDYSPDTEDHGYTNTSLRVRYTATSNATRIRLKLKGSITRSNTNIRNISIGEEASNFNCTTTPTEIFTGGSSGMFVYTGKYGITDWFDFDISKGTSYLITFDLEADASNDDVSMNNSTGDGAVAQNSSGSNSGVTYNVATFGTRHATENTGKVWCLDSVETLDIATLDTDIIGQISRNGGGSDASNWTDIPLKRIKTQVGGSPNNLLVGNATLTSTTGTNIVGRIKTANKDKITVQGISVNWS